MVQWFERFTSAVFEVSRCWHRLAEEELVTLLPAHAAGEANPLSPVSGLMGRLDLEGFYEKAVDWS